MAPGPWQITSVPFARIALIRVRELYERSLEVLESGQLIRPDFLETSDATSDCRRVHLEVDDRSDKAGCEAGVDVGVRREWHGSIRSDHCRDVGIREHVVAVLRSFIEARVAPGFPYRERASVAV